MTLADYLYDKWHVAYKEAPSITNYQLNIPGNIIKNVRIWHPSCDVIFQLVDGSELIKDSVSNEIRVHNYYYRQYVPGKGNLYPYLHELDDFYQPEDTQLEYGRSHE